MRRGHRQRLLLYFHTKGYNLNVLTSSVLVKLRPDVNFVVCVRLVIRLLDLTHRLLIKEVLGVRLIRRQRHEVEVKERVLLKRLLRLLFWLVIVVERIFRLLQ